MEAKTGLIKLASMFNFLTGNTNTQQVLATVQNENFFPILTSDISKVTNSIGLNISVVVKESISAIIKKKKAAAK